MMHRWKLETRMLMGLSCLVVMALSTPALAKPRRGIVGQQAPALKVGTWFNVPKGKAAPDIKGLKDHVVVLFFFQSW